jgi:hypothetical protein
MRSIEPGISRFRVRARARPGMTTHTSAFPRRDASGFSTSSAPERGRGECRVPSAPAASCAKVVVGMHTSIHSEFTGIARHPHAMVYSLYRALLGDRAFLPPSPLGSLLPGDLNASVGASGPHGFAVRIGAVRQERRHVHRIQPRVRDDRDTPLEWGGRRQFYTDLLFRKIRIFLQKGLDEGSRGARGDLPVGSDCSARAARRMPREPALGRHWITPACNLWLYFLN